MTSPGLFRPRPRNRAAHARRALLRLELLESRTVPYAASGNLWPHPELITLSFVPDGTDLGGQSSNLFSTFNNAFGSATAWQNAILKAAQTWAQQANINFAVVSDNGADSGSGSYEQGDANFGDIRIGGFDFGNSNTLAMGYLPPPVNNYSVGGDIAFNTAQVFNINGLDYDLYTVALHELGHALGLNHSDSASAIMYPVYQGVEYGLASDDVSGIQSIYGAPKSDAYDAAASNNTIGTASDINSTIDPTALTAVLTNLNITSSSGVDYYQFTAPTGGNGSLALTVQSTGLSLLAPSVKVYNSSLKLIASTSGSGDFGSTLSLNVGVTPGLTYYIRVAGANSSAFGMGAYGMVLNLGTGATPSLPLPNTQTANGNPLNGGGGMADRTDAQGLSVSEMLGGSESGDLPYTDLLTVGDGRPAARPTSAVATPPQQAATPEVVALPTPVVPPAAPAASVPATPAVTAPPAALVPTAIVQAAQLTRSAATTAAALAPQDRPTAQGSHEASAAVGTPLLPAVSAAGIARVPQDGDADEPASEPPAPPAEFEASPDVAPIPAGETASAAACDACFGAADWREDAAGSVLPPHAAGLADEPARAAEPAAFAAVFVVALAPTWGGRSAEADSWRRPACPR